MSKVEDLSYRGESSSDVRAFERYREDVQRGKGLLQLLAVKEAVTPEIRKAWSPRTFTSINTPQGTFGEVVCTISYHFHKHGAKYGSVFAYTRTAQQYFAAHKSAATLTNEGLLQLPKGKFERDGRIVFFE